MASIPDLPGVVVVHNSDQEIWLKQLVAKLCGLDNERFPGSQPVSFGLKDLDKLEAQDYWVCEKSDGVRVLLFVQTDIHTMDQMVYIIDRHNTYRQLSGLFFPHHENPRNPLRNSIVDGELVIDVDPRTQQETLRYLAFDCLVVDDQNVMSRTLDKRYGRLKAWFYKPYAKMMQDHPRMAETQPFDIKIKNVQLSYHVEDVFNIDIPALQHGNDGLIYTCVSTSYIPGTDHNILKWKPPSENSIDFKLMLRFPPLAGRPSQPDFFAKPVFELHVWCGDDRGIPRYELYDVMHVEDDEWETSVHPLSSQGYAIDVWSSSHRMKSSGEQLDDRIVEVHWDPIEEHWRMMRFRDDKPNGNHRSVVENIIKSIADGVEKDILFARSSSIRNSWKARQGQPAASQPPSQPPQPHPLPPKPTHAPYTQPLPPKPQPAAPAPAAPNAEPHYGPLATSRWSKVTGPDTVAGMYR
ncbi:mRNA-capping enzyme subunit alpha [Grifola frondosa]|uniref:mRNA-capping enzyme subunit alpha n=1 Tax=Grifola frondosa TaxID=5627 RepID=A0A1C7LWI6_GRIFR|nr:mRNA-capping enzyme subunit alpha [Grifola frondosa]